MSHSLYLNGLTVNSNVLSGLAAPGSDLTAAANKQYVDDAVSATAAAAALAVTNLIDSAPVALNTLNELAAALGDDANYATTTATLIGTKATILALSAAEAAAATDASTKANAAQAAAISAAATDASTKASAAQAAAISAAATDASTKADAAEAAAALDATAKADAAKAAAATDATSKANTAKAAAEATASTDATSKANAAQSAAATDATTKASAAQAAAISAAATDATTKANAAITAAATDATAKVLVETNRATTAELALKALIDGVSDDSVAGLAAVKANLIEFWEYFFNNADRANPKPQPTKLAL